MSLTAQAAASKATSKSKKLEAENKALRTQNEKLLKQLEDARNAKRPTTARANTGAKAKPRTKGDTVRLILGDVHGSYANKAALSALYKDIPVIDPNEIILMGDMVDCGGFLAQHHTLGYVAQLGYTYEDDIKAGNAFLDNIQNLAPRAQIHYIEGNHESRVERWAITQALKAVGDANFLSRMVSPRKLLEIDGRGIQYYPISEIHGDCRVPGWVRLGKVLFVHALGTSANAARAAALKTGGNVVFAHTHRADMAILNLPHPGLFGAWNFGCLCELQKLFMHTNPSNWSHGYGIQLVSRSSEFITIPVHINEGHSLLGPLLKK